MWADWTYKIVVSFKCAAACFGGGGGGGVNHLVGQADEVDICLNGTDTRALLDTGSMVSTISESLIGKLKLQAKALNDLIRIEGAGGHNIRYSGYVEAEIKFADLPVESTCALFLVVPDTV